MGAFQRDGQSRHRRAGTAVKFGTFIEDMSSLGQVRQARPADVDAHRGLVTLIRGVQSGSGDVHRESVHGRQQRAVIGDDRGRAVQPLDGEQRRRRGAVDRVQPVVRAANLELGLAGRAVHLGYRAALTTRAAAPAPSPGRGRHTPSTAGATGLSVVPTLVDGAQGTCSVWTCGIALVKKGADAIVVNNRGVVVRPSTGTWLACNQAWTSGAYYGDRGTFFADVTGDGLADAIVVNNGGVVVRRSTGSAFGSNESWTSGGYYGDKGTFFANVDGR